MSKEIRLTPEQEAKKEAWLKNLADFIVIANGKTWAADGAEVEPRRPGYKRLQWPYPENKMSEQDLKDYKGWEDWRLEDEYTGYFRAPGMTTVYYKDQPAWTMHYGGHGQTEGYEDRAKQTYEFALFEGDITDCLWREKIIEDDQLTFTQTGLAGIVIQRDSNRQSSSPWDL